MSVRYCQLQGGVEHQGISTSGCQAMGVHRQYPGLKFIAWAFRVSEPRRPKCVDRHRGFDGICSPTVQDPLVFTAALRLTVHVAWPSRVVQGEMVGRRIDRRFPAQIPKRLAVTTVARGPRGAR
jgi:hypothetical protein